MNLPPIVKVGAADYSVTVVEETPMSGAAELCGACDVEKKAIAIREQDTKNSVRLLEVLFHEVGHAVVAHFGIELAPAKEDRAVDAVARGLVMLMRDNPTLFRRALDALKED